MALAARKQSTLREYEADETRYESTSPRFTVIQGKGNSENQSLEVTPFVLEIAKIALVVAVAFALLGVVRITLNAQTVNTMIESSELNDSLVAAKSTCDELEVQRSVYASPDRVRGIAEGSLGMVAPATVAELNVGNDVEVSPTNNPGEIVASVE